MAALLVFTCNQNRQFPPMCTRAGRVEFARGPLRARAAAPARPAQPGVMQRRVMQRPALKHRLGYSRYCHSEFVLYKSSRIL
jgi:hypothetical protein